MNSKYEDKILTEIAKEMGLKPEVINSVIKTTNRFLIKEMGEGSIDEIDKLQTICLPVLGKFIPKKNLKKWNHK